MKNRKLWVSILAGFLAFVLTFGLVAGVLPYFVEGKSASQLQGELAGLKADKKEIDKKIKELEGQLKDNKKDMKAIVARKNAIDQQVALIYEQVDNLNEQIATYNGLIADKQEELDAAQAHLTELNRKNKDRIRAMEEDGKLSYWSVLFKASSFADLLDRFNMIEEIAASDQRRLKEMSETAKAVAEAKAAMEAEMAAMEANKAELAASEEQLESKREEADKLLAELVATEEEYRKLLEEAEAKEDELSSDIKETQKELDALESSKPGSTSKPVTTTTPSGITWVVPVKYQKVSSPFGYRIHPVYKDWRMHYGIDLAAAKNTPIYAARSGTVEFAKWNDSAGNYVKIDHGDGFDTIYMHMTRYIVKTGEKVTAGQVIGYVGSTGTSTGNHLHFGMQYKGAYVNPADQIKF